MTYFLSYREVKIAIGIGVATIIIGVVAVRVLGICTYCCYMLRIQKVGHNSYTVLPYSFLIFSYTDSHSERE